MDQQRTLPLIDIKGDTFIVDLHSEGLRSAEQPFTTLRFADMQTIPEVNVVPFPQTYPDQKFSLLRFFYKQDSKEMFFLPPYADQVPEGVVLIETVHPSFLDPFVYAQKLGVKPYLPAEFLEHRHHQAKEVPIVRLMGEDYIIDVPRQIVVHVTDVNNKLKFDRIPFNLDDKSMCLLVDVGTGMLCGIDLRHEHKKLQAIIKPAYDVLDPISFERLKGKAVGFFKETSPQQNLQPPDQTERTVRPGKRNGGNRIG